MASESRYQQRRFRAEAVLQFHSFGIDAFGEWLKVASDVGIKLRIAEGVFPKTTGFKRFVRATAEKFSRLTPAQATAAIRTAVIALAHSAFDDHLYELLRLTTVLVRDRILDGLNARKISLQVVRGKSAQEIENEVLATWCDEQRRKSLLDKWSLLHALIPPSPETDSAFRYDEARVRRFDEVRHDAVHHDGVLLHSYDLPTELSFMDQTVVHLCQQVKARHTLGFDPSATREIPIESVFPRPRKRRGRC